MELCRTIENENAIENETMEKMGYGNGQSLTMKKKDKSGMERSRKIEKMGYRNGTECNGPQQKKIWRSGMERFRVMEKTMKKWDTGMGGSRTMEKMG